MASRSLSGIAFEALALEDELLYVYRRASYREFVDHPFPDGRRGALNPVEEPSSLSFVHGLWWFGLICQFD